MQIGTSYSYDRGTAQLRDLSTKATQLQSNIAASKRLTTPSIDPVAAGRIALLDRQLADSTQNAANVNLATALLNQSDSALESVQTQIQRATELALRASNDTLSTSDRSAIAAELQSIVDDLYAVVNQRDLRDTALFGGATSAEAYTRDVLTGVISYAGTGEASPIPIGANGTVIATDSGDRLFGGIVAGGETRDMFSIVGDLAKALAPGGAADAVALRAEVDRGLAGLNATGERLANARASVGARGARLEIEAERIAATAIETTVEVSKLDGFDLQTSIAELQQTMLTLQAAQATFAQLSKLSLFDYLR